MLITPYSKIRELRRLHLIPLGKVAIMLGIKSKTLLNRVYNKTFLLPDRDYGGVAKYWNEERLNKYLSEIGDRK